MSKLYEYYNTGDDSYLVVNATIWQAQTFTPQMNYTLKSVRLKLYKQGSPNILTVSIRSTDSNGHPTKNELVGTGFDTASITTDPAGAWYEIVFSSGINLVQGIKYALYLAAATATSGNEVRWLQDSTAPSYNRGNVETTSDNGTTWTASASVAMFETWGDPYAGPSNPPQNVQVYSIPGIGIEVRATFRQANGLPATYARFQLSTVNDFSTLLYDTGQIPIQPINDGQEGAIILNWLPTKEGTYYYRLCFWDSLNYTNTDWTVWNGTTMTVQIGSTNNYQFTYTPTNENITIHFPVFISQEVSRE
jgi:hypothetical protein